MNRIVTVLLAGIIAVLVHMLIFASPLGGKVETWFLDLWFNLRGKISSPEEIAIVAMDEMSYSNLNIPLNQPWPRALHAELLKRLAEFEVKRVAFDILFLGESPDKQADAALTDAVKLVPSVLAIESAKSEQGLGGGTFNMEKLLSPSSAMVKNAFSVGLVSLPEDNGFVRRFQTERTQLTKNYPNLSEAGIGLTKPMENGPGFRDFINYYGPPGTIPTFSYYQVLDEEVPMPKEFLKDKIVFVGLKLGTETGPAQKDSYRTPFFTGGHTFGLEIQAMVAGNLIDKSWIRRLSKGVEALIMIVVTFIVTGAIFWLRPQWAGLLWALFSAGWCIFAYLCFLQGLFIPGVVLLSFILPVSYLISTLVYYFVTSRSQRQVEKAFQYYLSPEMAHEMRKNPNAMSLGGDNVWGTALFTDIEGFTDITETMLAQNVSGMLNAYFTEVMDVIFEKKGTLIKFIGDAVFVIWGAPIKISEHAQLAVETAIAIQQGVEKFNATGRFPPLHTRVGINTGQMVVGNLGSAKRFDYTAIGDSVNQAARVEGINKYFGTKILITDATKKEIGGLIKTVPIGKVRVKGKKEAAGLHAVFAEPVTDEIISLWSEGIELFRQRKWEEARGALKSASEKDNRLLKACEFYAAEISRNASEAPAPEWQGEIEFKSK